MLGNKCESGGENRLGIGFDNPDERSGDFQIRVNFPVVINQTEINGIRLHKHALDGGEMVAKEGVILLDQFKIKAVFRFELRGRSLGNHGKTRPDHFSEMLVRNLQKRLCQLDIGGDLAILVNKAEVQLVQTVDHALGCGEVLLSKG